MYEIHFTAADIARTRIVPSYGPYAEAMFGLSVMASGSRSAAAFEGWRQRLVGVPHRWTRPLAALMGRREPMLDLFTLIGPVGSAEQGTEALLAAPRRHLEAEIRAAALWAAARGHEPQHRLPAWAFQLASDREARRSLAAALRACCAATIDPYWARIQIHLMAEVAASSRTLAEGGIARLLAELHLDTRWQAGALLVGQTGHTTQQVADQLFPHRDVGVTGIHLNGRGLVLVPSVFCRRVTPYISVADHDGPVVLFYPVLRDIVDAHRLWTNACGPVRKELVALLGATRAVAMDVLTRPTSTTELARRLQVSLATASHHATVLRAAGLVTSRRRGGSVLHVLSPLGEALLNGQRPIRTAGNASEASEIGITDG